MKSNSAFLGCLIHAHAPANPLPDGNADSRSHRLACFLSLVHRLGNCIDVETAADKSNISVCTRSVHPTLALPASSPLRILM